MNTRTLAFIVAFCLLPVTVLATEVMPQRLTFLAEGRPYPNKPITVRCTVTSKGLLPEERVNIVRETGPGFADQGQEMKLITVESDKRIYESIIDTLPVGEHTFACHVRFASDDHENIKKKFGNLYTIGLDNLSGTNVVDMSTALYVRVKDDQVVTSGLPGVNIEKKELIGIISKKQKIDLSDEELMKKSITELEEINGGPLLQNTTVVSSEQPSQEGQAAFRPIPRPKPVMPDSVQFIPKGRTLPKKPITMRCTVTSEEALPEERVTIIKEMYDNEAVLEEELKLTEAKPGQRVYEYVTEPLPPGDYKFKCNVHYVSDDYEMITRKNDKKDVRVNKRAEDQFEIDVARSWYILVREDEVVSAGWDFDHIEKDKLARQIQKKQKSELSYPNMLGKGIEELEAINGEALPKYKAFGASRPK